jgi:hypothetical protein
VALGLTIFEVKSQTKAEEQKETIKLELIWQKEFPEGIQDFGIGMSKEGESYLQTVATGSKLLFYEKEELKSREVEYSKSQEGGVNEVYVTENGKYLLHYWRKMDESEKEWAYRKLFVYDRSGNLLWKRDSLSTYSPLLALNGEYAVGSTWYSGLTWLHRDGSEKTIDPLSEELWRLFFTFSSDSKYWAISVGEPKADPKHSGAWLIMYDSRGNEVWRKQLEPKGIAGEVALSHSGKWIGVNAPEGGRFVPLFFHLFDVEGNLLWRSEIGSRGNYKIVFSPQDDYVVLLNNVEHIYIFETSSGRLVWDYQFPEDVSIGQDLSFYIPIISFDISKDGNYIVVAGREKKKREDYIYFFDKREGFLTQFSIGPIETARLPIVKFDPLGKHLFVDQGNLINKFLMEEKQ